MSTSIDGIYFNCSNTDEVLDVIEEIKPRLNQEIQQICLEDITKKILSDFTEIIINDRQINMLDGVMEKYFGTDVNEDKHIIENMNLINLHLFKYIDELNKEPNKRNALYEDKNYNSGIYFFKQKTNKLAPTYLGIIYSNTSKIQDIILEHPLINDYSYYNAHDGQVKEIGYKNWKRRGRNWDKILPSYNVEKHKSFEIVISNNTDIIYNSVNEDKIIEYIKQNYVNIVKKIIDQQIISNSLSHYMKTLNIDPEDTQGLRDNFKMSDFLTIERISKKHENYQPETEKEKILFICYKEAKKETQDKTKILFEQDIKNVIQNPIKEIVKLKEKIDLESNQDSNTKYQRKKL